MYRGMYAVAGAAQMKSWALPVEQLTTPTPPTISPSVTDYLRASLSDNSRRAYRADLNHFLAWGGTIPATPEMIAVYLADHAELHAPATRSAINFTIYCEDMKSSRNYLAPSQRGREWSRKLHSGRYCENFARGVICPRRRSRSNPAWRGTTCPCLSLAGTAQA